MSDNKNTKTPLTEEQLEEMRKLYADPGISLRQIGAQFGVSEGAVRKYAKKRGWIRSMVEPIRQRAEEILIAAAASGEKVPEVPADAPVEQRAARALHELDERDERALRQAPMLDGEVITEEETIERNAIAQAIIINHERQDIRRARWLSNMLMDELLAQSGDPVSLNTLIAAVADGNESMSDALRRMCSLPSRVSSMNMLAGTLEKLIKLERLVHRIDADDGKGKTVEDLLAEIGAGG